MMETKKYASEIITDPEPIRITYDISGLENMPSMYSHLLVDIERSLNMAKGFFAE